MLTTQGTITANGGAVTLTANGLPNIAVQVTGTWQLDLIAQGSNDGSTWSNPLTLWAADTHPEWVGYPQLGMNAISGAQSRNGVFFVRNPGFLFFRIAAQAAGGTPGTATVTLNASHADPGAPEAAYNICLLDNVDISATRVSPVIPSPGPGWVWDQSKTVDVGGTSTGVLFTPEFCDTYAFVNYAAGEVAQAMTNITVGTGAFYFGEDAPNANRLFLCNYLRFRLTATAYPPAGTKITIYGNFMRVLDGPFAFDPYTATQVADTTKARGELGNFQIGPNRWLGALLLGNDAPATDGGNMRRVKVSSDGLLHVSMDNGGAAPGAVAIFQQKGNGANPFCLRNLGATVQQIKATFGSLLSVTICNSTAATCWVQLFGVPSGSVTLGSTTPAYEIMCPANTTVNIPISVQGFATASGISAASTTLEMGTVGSATGVVVSGAYV